jgi:hypothetical protein
VLPSTANRRRSRNRPTSLHLPEAARSAREFAIRRFNLL